jgi:hypothetical protein
MELPIYNGPPKSLDEAIERKKKVTNSFNKELFWMLDMMVKVAPGKGFERIKSLASLARTYDYHILITNTGPYLYKYKAQIEAKDLDFIDEGLIGKHIDERNVVDNIRQFVFEIFGAIKEYYGKMTPSERAKIQEKTIDMLKLYCHFALLEKDERELRSSNISA